MALARRGHASRALGLCLKIVRLLKKVQQPVRPALGAAAREARAKLVYVSNPDNPMGTWNSGAAIQELLDRHLPGDCMLLLDEAYAEFAAKAAKGD